MVDYSTLDYIINIIVQQLKHGIKVVKEERKSEKE